MFLLPGWLVWASARENEHTGVIAARLKNITVEDYEKSQAFQLIPDSGMDISGLAAGTPDPVTVFIG